MENHNDKFIFAMYLMFLRSPGRKTLPGEPVDLGEIGSNGDVCEARCARLALWRLGTPILLR
jgi:hypothetical protein